MMVGLTKRKATQEGENKISNFFPALMSTTSFKQDSRDKKK